MSRAVLHTNDEIRFLCHTLKWSSCSESYLWITDAFSTRNNWSCSPQTISTSYIETHTHEQEDYNGNNLRIIRRTQLSKEGCILEIMVLLGTCLCRPWSPLEHGWVVPCSPWRVSDRSQQDHPIQYIKWFLHLLYSTDIDVLMAEAQLKLEVYKPAMPAEPCMSVRDQIERSKPSLA
jgi:hypothetical protein